MFTVALQADHVHAALAQSLQLPARGPGLLTALGGGVTVLVFIALRATFAAVAVLLEPVFALVRLLLKLVLVFAVVVALVVLVGLGKLGGRGDAGTVVPTGTPIGTSPAGSTPLDAPAVAPTR